MTSIYSKCGLWCTDLIDLTRLSEAAGLDRSIPRSPLPPTSRSVPRYIRIPSTARFDLEQCICRRYFNLWLLHPRFDQIRCFRKYVNRSIICYHPTTSLGYLKYSAFILASVNPGQFNLFHAPFMILIDLADVNDFMLWCQLCPHPCTCWILPVMGCSHLANRSTQILEPTTDFKKWALVWGVHYSNIESFSSPRDLHVSL